MSRAGSTLQYNLTRSLLERLKVGHGLHFLNTENELRNAALVAKGKGAITAIKTYQYDLGWLDGTDAKVSKLCIFRDLRDVYSSRKKKRGESLDNFLKQTRKDLEGLNRLSASGEVLWQQYEDVILDLQGATREIATFLGLKAGDDDIATVAKLNTLDAALKEISLSFTARERFISKANKFFARRPLLAKQLLRTIGITKLVRTIIPPANVLSSNSHLHPDHISRSRGMPGKWREELSEMEAQLITETFSEWLKQHNYL